MMAAFVVEFDRGLPGLTFAGRDSLTAARMHQTCRTVETIVGICDLCWGHGRWACEPLNDSVCLLFTDPPCRLHV